VGLPSHARDWPAALSGGQRQRVALARALVSRPRLLLLDEPLGALDAFTRVEMQQLIERIWSDAGFTAVIVTHDVEEAIALADRVIALDQGQVALEVAVDLPRPRQRHGAAFVALAAQVLEHLTRKTDDPAGPDLPASRA
jgi:sulfonate transport system ATP-binding protein